MTKAYKFTHLPEGYSKLAIAVWKSLPDQELFEIDGRLVFTDDIEAYRAGRVDIGYMADVYDSHAAFERWLLNCAADWCVDCPEMLEELESHLNVN